VRGRLISNARDVSTALAISGNPKAGPKFRVLACQYVCADGLPFPSHLSAEALGANYQLYKDCDYCTHGTIYILIFTTWLGLQRPPSPCKAREL
jgi:hypothetical protein